MARVAGLSLAVVLLALLAVDPFSYSYHWSYDAVASAWWKQAIALADGALLAAAVYGLWHRRRVVAILAASIDLGFALSAGLAIGHRDLIRIALAGWAPFQVFAAVYALSLVLRVVLLTLCCAAAPAPVRAPAT